MISVVTEHGSSFKGLAAYLLHDIGSKDSSERVAWTYTHNLASDDPEQAWRAMLATAKCQDELKAEHRIKNTGRKSHRSVCHYVLSWHPDEHGEFSREEMIDAALASMTYLGVDKGERLTKKQKALRTQRGIEHQAVIVCHDEGPGENPHLHVMLNRVHPEHGTMLPDKQDYQKLSAWALDYRRSQGKEHMCPERVKNEAKKAQGVLTSHPRKPRNIYEQEQAIAEAEPNSRTKTLLEQLAKKARAMKAEAQKMKSQHAQRLRDLDNRQLAAQRAERAEAAEQIRERRSQIRSDYAPKIDALVEKQSAERSAFFEGHHTAAGRVRNTWKAFQTKEWMRDIRTRPMHALKQGFTLAFDAGMQLRDIEKFHKREKGQLRGQRTGEERQASAEIRQGSSEHLEDLRQGYIRERTDTVFEHRMELAKLRTEWWQLTQHRRAVLAEEQRSLSHSPAAPGDGSGPSDEEQTPAVKQEHTDQSRETRTIDPREGPIEEVRKDREKERKLAKIEAMRERLKKARDRNRDQGRGRGL